MAQLEPVMCYTCGSSISNKYELFLAAKEKYLAWVNRNTKPENRIHVESKQISNDLNEDLIPVFEAIAINKMCCRMHIANIVTVTQLRE